MAQDDAGKLLVRIEVSQAKIEKQMAAIAARAAKNADAIEQKFQKANDNVARGFQRSGKQVERSLGVSRAAAQNLGFQLNDIATQLASGTSPLRVMAQQGGQVAQALQGAGGAAGAVRALGGAFAGLLNPIGLISVALIGVTGYAAQYLTSLISDGDDAKKTLEDQAELIGRVAEKWGDALPALKAYNDERKKLKDESDIRQAAESAAQGQYDKLRELIKQTRIEAADLISLLSDAGQDTSEIVQLQGAFKDLFKGVEEGKGSVKQLRSVQAELENQFRMTGIPVLQDYAAHMGELADEIQRASDNAAKFRFDAAIRDFQQSNPLGGLPGSVLGVPAELRGDLNAQQTARANATKSQVEIEAEKSLKGVAKAAGETKDSFDRLNDGAVRNFVNQVVKAESGGNRFAKNPNSSATGLGQFISSTWLRLFKENFPDRAKSMADATILALRSDADISRSLIEAYARENADLLRQAGVAVNEAALHLAHFLGPGGAIKVLQAAPNTPVSQLLSPGAIAANPSILGNGATAGDVVAYGNRRAAIVADMAANYKTAAQAAREFGQAQKAAARQAEELGAAVGGALKGLIDAFEDGKLSASELLQIVGRLVVQLGRMPGGFLGGSGSFLGGILGAFFHDGGVVGGPAKMKAMPASTWSNAKRYHTGTMSAGGPALMPGDIPAILQRGEVVLPRGMKMGGGGQSIVINAPINAPGADAAQLARVEKSVNDLHKAIPKRVDNRTDARNVRKTRA